MKKIILLVTGILGILVLCGISVNAEEPHHTRWQEVGSYDVVTDTFYPLIGTNDTEEQIQEEIKDGEIEMLAQLVEAEAGNQDYHGKCLVADVVLNRVASDKFPDTIEEVIQDRVPCVQFASVSIYDGGFERAGWHISEDSFKAARQEYEAINRIDPKILFFTAEDYNPYCILAYKYGDHYFGY